MENKYINFFTNSLKKSFNTTVTLLKIMIPVSIITKLLEIIGVIDLIGKILEPIMKLVGLPGEFGLVWATSIITNIYGGLLVFFNIHKNFNITTAQVSILAVMLLIAHTFPIENIICRKAGIRLRVITFFRLINAFLLGFFLNFFYSTFNLHQNINKLSWVPSQNNSTFIRWITGEIKNYIFIFLIITALIFLIDLLKATNMIKFINKIFNPVLKLLGISKKATPLTVVGMTLGLTYGGGLIINEAKNNNLTNRDIFYSLIFLSLCHSFIEDSLLMLSIGASISGVFIARLLYAIITTFVIVKLTKKLSDKNFNKLFIHD